MTDPLDDMIFSLRALAEMPGEATKAAAPLVLAAAQASASSGHSPDGTPLKPTKMGGQPLKNSAAAFSATASGTVVVLKLEGVEVLHNYGTQREPKRQILPGRFDPIPPKFAAAIKTAADAEFAKITGAK